MQTSGPERLSPNITPDGIDVDPQGKVLLPPWFIDGLNSFLTAATCDIVGYQESFFRSVGADALAHRASLSRGQAGCYTGSLPSYEVEVGSPPFNGGQCHVNYQVNARASYNPDILSAPDRAYPFQTSGPIIRTYVVDGSLRCDHGDPVETINFGGYAFEEFWIVSVSRVDGQPDNCGDPPSSPTVFPPAVEPYPVPAPGFEIRPTGKVDVNVDVGGVTVPVGVFYTPLTLNANGTASFNLGGVEVNINPDFSIDVGNGNGGELDDGSNDALNELSNQVSNLSDTVGTIGNQVETIADIISLPIGGMLMGTGCGENTIVREYSGNGLEGIQSEIEALSLVLDAVLLQLCPLPDVAPDYEFLPLGSCGSLENRRFYDFDLPDDSLLVFVDATSSHPPYAVAADAASGNDAVQSRYGQLFLLRPEDSRYWAELLGHLYYSEGVFVLPSGLPPDCKLRISLYPGARAVLSVAREI